MWDFFPQGVIVFLMYTSMSHLLQVSASRQPHPSQCEGARTDARRPEEEDRLLRVSSFLVAGGQIVGADRAAALASPSSLASFVELQIRNHPP